MARGRQNTGQSKFDNFADKERQKLCQYCRDQFDTVMERKRHERVCPTKVAPENYKCDFCEKSFASKAGVKRHVSFCSRKSSEKSAERRKVVNISEKSPENFKRNSCEKSFGSRSQKKSQQKVPEKWYFCNTCEIWLENEISFRKHECVRAPEAQQEKFKCQLCKKNFSSKQGLAGHEKVHTNKKIKCDKCDKYFLERFYNGHLRNHGRINDFKLKVGQADTHEPDIEAEHEIEVSEIQEELVENNASVIEPNENGAIRIIHQDELEALQEDGQALESNGDVAENFQIENNPEIDSQVEEQEVQPNALIEKVAENPDVFSHVTEFENNREIDVQAEEQEVQPNALIENNVGQASEIEEQLVQQSSKDFECDVCQTICDTAYNLRVHQEMLHGKDGNYKCRICNSTFNQIAELTEHINENHENKAVIAPQGEKFLCGTCNKTFRNQRALRLHSRIHKFSCDDCKRSFKNEEQLKSHNDIHHAPGDNVEDVHEEANEQVEDEVPNDQVGNSADEPDVSQASQVFAPDLFPIIYCGVGGCQVVHLDYNAMIKHKKSQHQGEIKFFCELNSCNSQGFRLHSNFLTHLSNHDELQSVAGDQNDQDEVQDENSVNENENMDVDEDDSDQVTEEDDEQGQDEPEAMEEALPEDDNDQDEPEAMEEAQPEDDNDQDEPEAMEEALPEDDNDQDEPGQNELQNDIIESDDDEVQVLERQAMPESSEANVEEESEIETDSEAIVDDDDQDSEESEAIESDEEDDNDIESEFSIMDTDDSSDSSDSEIEE